MMSRSNKSFKALRAYSAASIFEADDEARIEGITQARSDIPAAEEILH